MAFLKTAFWQEENRMIWIFKFLALAPSVMLLMLIKCGDLRTFAVFSSLFELQSKRTLLFFNQNWFFFFFESFYFLNEF